MAKGKKILKWFAGIILTIVLLIVIAIIGTGIFLTNKNLSGLVEKYATQFLNAEIKSDTINVHIFKHFPYLTFSMTNGEVISKALQAERDSSAWVIPTAADTLLTFKRVYVSISLTDLVRSKINIPRFAIESPQVYAYVSNNGTANYDIVKSTPPTNTESADSTSMDIKIKRVGIFRGGHVKYDNRQDSLLLNVDLQRLNLRGNFSTDLSKTQIDRGYLSRFILSINKLSANSEFVSLAAKGQDSLSLSGDIITKGGVTTSASFAIDSLRMRRNNNSFNIAALTYSNLSIDDFTLIKNIPFEIIGEFNITDTLDTHRIEINKLRIDAAKIPIEFSGDLELCQDTLWSRSGFKGKVDNFKLSELFEYIPEEIFPAVNLINTDAVLNLDLLMSGYYNFKTGELPTLEAQLSLPKSSIEFKGIESRINELEADIHAYYSTKNRAASAVNINKFVIKGRGANFTLGGEITDLAGADPYIDVELKAGAYLDTLSRLFTEEKGSIFAGSIDADFFVKSHLSKLNMANIGDANIKGTLTTDSALIVIPSERLFAYVKNSNLFIGTTNNTRDSSIQQGMRMFGLNLTTDTLRFFHKDNLHFVASDLRIAGHNSTSIMSGDTTKVHPLNGLVTAKRLELRTSDSLNVRAREANLTFGILPYEGDYSTPVLKADLKARSFGIKESFNLALVRNGDISVEAIINNRENKEAKARREAFLDTLQKRYPKVERDSLFSHFAKQNQRRRRRVKDDFAGQDLNFKVDNSIGALIRRWNINGSIKAANGGLVTPYLPLRTRLQNINFTFNSDSLDFKETLLRCGSSVMEFTGHLSGMRRALLRNGTIKVIGEVNSDSLNFNELITAMHRSSEILAKIEQNKDSLTAITDETELATAISSLASDSTSTESSLIVIPSNLEAELKIAINKGKYSDLELKEVKSEILVKDRCLQLKEFEAISNAGEMDFSGFYATRSKSDLSTGFDLELKDIEIEKFIALIPDIDTLLPMLKSFEGLINCQIAATSQIDTSMNIILPTLKGVARITGDSLILMDGQTFSSIAKKLKFKNKKRNLIDRISVEMLLNENKIEVFPFLAQIDRYSFAISGTQNLDLSFNYHISVLQSPIPFRLGVTIFGDTDDFSFKIGRAKYKSANLPVYSTMIDSTRLNLREQIANIYRIGIDAALKNSRNMERLQREKNRVDAELGGIDSLSATERMQYNSIITDSSSVTIAADSLITPADSLQSVAPDSLSPAPAPDSLAPDTAPDSLAPDTATDSLAPATDTL